MRSKLERMEDTRQATAAEVDQDKYVRTYHTITAAQLTLAQSSLPSSTAMKPTQPISRTTVVHARSTAASRGSLARSPRVALPFNHGCWLTATTSTRSAARDAGRVITSRTLRSTMMRRRTLCGRSGWRRGDWGGSVGFCAWGSLGSVL